MDNKCMLIVGKLCLDIVHVVSHYPEEDSDTR